MLSKYSRSVFSKRVSSITGVSKLFASTLDGYGDHLFKGSVAAPYLKKQGLSATHLDSHKWTTDGSADKVGCAILLTSILNTQLKQSFLK